MNNMQHKSLKSARSWLLQMQNKSGGFAGSFSFIRGRRPDFAEVTGYIIPTLIELGRKSDANPRMPANDANDNYMERFECSELHPNDANECLEAAQKAGEWLLSIQNPEGWFFHWPAPDKPMVFDTGQVIFGLLALARYPCHSPVWRGNLDPRLRGDDKKGDKYLQAAVKAGDWICSVQEADGSWIKCAYNNIPHTYYSRVSWALLELWKITGDEKYKSAAVRQLDWVLAQQREDGSFNNYSFFADDNPVLHVVAYTIEGLLYSGLLLGDNYYIEAAKRGLKKMPPDSWSCLTGLAQLSCVLFKLYEITKDGEIASSREGGTRNDGSGMTYGDDAALPVIARRSPEAADEAISYLKQARRINRYLKTKQFNWGPKIIKGALPGSSPIWGRYMPFSLPVWSAKFWLDALLWEKKFKQDYLTAAIFPNDSLRAYLEKGELRKDYFSPGNVFSEIYIFDPKKDDYTDEEKQKLQFMMGKAQWGIANLTNDIGCRYFDVIRAYGVGKSTEKAARLSQRFHLPLVISLHGNYDLGNRYQTLRRGVLVKYLYYTFRSWFIIPKILKQAAKILAVYQFAADYALSKNISKDKVAVIYNRVYPDVFYPMSSLRGTPNLFRGTEAVSRDDREDVFTLITVGRLIFGKNQKTIIKAIKDLNARLLVVGQGPEEKKLKELALSLGISDRIQFVPKIDNQNLAEFYNQSSVYVTACRYGGLEIPVIEAMACGLPIIRSKHPREKEPELLGFGGCLYVENNPETFAAAIKKLMGDQELYRRLSRKSLEIYQSINGYKMEEKEKMMVLEAMRICE